MVYCLRHIGLPPSNVKVKTTHSIKSETTLIGRGQAADVFLDSNIRKGLISRAHAQIIKTLKDNIECYTLYDTSLNGTYVNDVKVQGSTAIKDGDTIAFGHLRGVLIQPGAYAPQTESEFIFKFEKSVDDDEETKTEAGSGAENSPSVFMSPVSISKTCSDSNGSDGGGSNDTSEKTSRKRRRKSSDSELDALLNSVTKSMANNCNESQDLSFVINNDSDQKGSKIPSHPRNYMFPKHKPSLGNDSKDKEFDLSVNTEKYVDIKSDTSISIGHSSANEISSRDSVKRKMKEILDVHDSDMKIENNVNEAENNVNAIVNVEVETNGSTYEDFTSESSEEVTDDDSNDSDFSLENYKSPVKKPRSKRTKKAPTKFSPSHSSNKLSADQPSKRTYVPRKQTASKYIAESSDEQSNEEKYEHDKCASVDCRRPPNSLKKVTWVQCEDCEKWYHLSCCGISPKAARNKDTVFRCGC